MQYSNRQFSTTESEIINDISIAINGEYQAIYCYEQLKRQTKNSEIMNQINEIQNDELRHYQMFSNLYTLLTGQHYSPQIIGKCPPNFQNGVLAAFKDEQKTVDFYNEVARKTDNSSIKETFLQASVDEQNHAVWFLYFLNHR
ncbi:ferritin family protein [Heyndrickxia ginsengihumi]|uniref:ferritin family protein n=1 Tax=Heyndrickxia ginsengihumi TaxID=363870 RepID=UPI003D1A5D84